MFISTKVEFLLPCSREECCRRLAAKMDRTDIGALPVIGRIRGTHLYARRRISYRNSFQTQLSANLIDQAGQTLVRGRFSMHPVVMGFLALWFTGVIIIGGAILIHSLMQLASGPSRVPSGVWLGIGIPVVLILFGVGLLRFGRHLARDDQPYLIDFIRRAAASGCELANRSAGDSEKEASFARRLQRRLAERRGAAMALFMSLFVLWGFGYETVGLRLGIALDGVVVKRQVIPRTWASHGTGMIYIVRGSNGVEQTYIAGATDGSLPQNIPLGAHIVKRKWELSYLLNGRRVHDFPIIFYTIILGGAMIAMIWAIFQLLRYDA